MGQLVGQRHVFGVGGVEFFEPFDELPLLAEGFEHLAQQLVGAGALAGVVLVEIRFEFRQRLGGLFLSGVDAGQVVQVQGLVGLDGLGLLEGGQRVGRPVRFQKHLAKELVRQLGLAQQRLLHRGVETVLLWRGQRLGHVVEPLGSLVVLFFEEVEPAHLHPRQHRGGVRLFAAGARQLERLFIQPQGPLAVAVFAEVDGQAAQQQQVAGIVLGQQLRVAHRFGLAIEIERQRHDLAQGRDGRRIEAKRALVVAQGQGVVLLLFGDARRGEQRVGPHAILVAPSCAALGNEGLDRVFQLVAAIEGGRAGRRGQRRRGHGHLGRGRRRATRPAGRPAPCMRPTSMRATSIRQAGSFVRIGAFGRD